MEGIDEYLKRSKYDILLECKELIQIKNIEIERLNKALLDIKECIKNQKQYEFSQTIVEELLTDVLDIVNKALGSDKK